MQTARRGSCQARDGVAGLLRRGRAGRAGARQVLRRAVHARLHAAQERARARGVDVTGRMTPRIMYRRPY